MLTHDKIWHSGVWEMLMNIHDIWQKYTIINLKRLITHNTCFMLLHDLVKNNINNFQHIPMNFRKCTVVGGLTRHFYCATLSVSIHTYIYT